MSDSPFKQKLLREAAEDFSYSLGNAALARNSLDEAIVLFRRALDVRSDNGKVLYNLALAFERLNRKEEAAVCAAAVHGPADYVQARCDLAQTYEIQGQWDAAVGAYGDALTAMPSHAEANLRMGLLLASLKRTAEAAPFFRRLLSAGGADLEIIGAAQLAHIGRELAAAGEPRDSERFLSLARILDPASVPAALGLATVFPLMKRFEECAVAWRRAVRLEPRNVSFWVLLASALFNVDRLDEAVQACRQALAIDEAQARENNVLLQLGTIKLHQGNFAEAENWLRQGMAGNSTPVIAARLRDTLGATCLAAGRLNEAEGFQQAALSLVPTLIGVKVRLGLTRLAQGRIAEALELHRECADAHPDNDYFISCFGLSLHLAGRMDEAIAAHRRAIEIQGLAAWQWDNLGLALAAVGRHEEALEAHRQAVRCQPNRVRVEARMRPWATAALFDAYRAIGFSE